MSDVTTIDINHVYRDSKFSQSELFSWKIVFICNECNEWNFFCIDLSKYRLITNLGILCLWSLKAAKWVCCVLFLPHCFLKFVFSVFLRFCVYPQDIVIQLQKRTRIRKIQLLSHQFMIGLYYWFVMFHICC